MYTKQKIVNNFYKLYKFILYRSALIIWNFIDSKKNNSWISKTLKAMYIFREVSK